MKTFKKSNIGKKIRVSKKGTASKAIGIIEKNTDTFILTYGQFSLIDALMSILDQTGPAHVAISTWTAAHADLTRSAELMSTGDFLSLRMIIDRSFKTRQPDYYKHMINLFGIDSVRAINTHAKFITVRNENWNIVVRTSMNLNGNPRLENIEISDNKEFANFFENIVANVFEEVKPATQCNTPDLKNIPETDIFQLIEAKHIRRSDLNEASYTHELQH